MKYASYTEAIEWIACNDDCDWTEDWTGSDGHGSASVTAHLVADVFGRSIDKVAADVIKLLTKIASDKSDAAIETYQSERGLG